MSKVGRAFALAAQVHVNQTDLSGEPYINHIVAVYHNATRLYLEKHGYGDPLHLEEVQCVAILHDVFEDFKGKTWEIGKLRDTVYRDFGPEIYAAVDALTKFKDDDYLNEYLPRVSANWRSRIAKLADLEHNLSIVRLPFKQSVEKVIERRVKYTKAYAYLITEEERWKG